MTIGVALSEIEIGELLRHSTWSRDVFIYMDTRDRVVKFNYGHPFDINDAWLNLADGWCYFI